MTQEGQKNIDPATIMTTITTASTTQLSGAPLSKNPLVVLLDIIRTEGPGQLWSGLLPRAARAIGSGAIQFTSYELSQNFMQSG